MILNLKAYSAYRDSSVEWLGAVPAHWKVRRLKQVAILNPGKAEARALLEQDAPVTFLPMERVYADGRIGAIEYLPISSVWNGFTYFRRGDVIIAKITPCFENGKGACLDALPTEIGFGSTEFHVLRAGSSITARFLYRITTLPDFRRLGADAMSGAAGQQRVPESFLANFIAPLPPLPEQTAIVRFLDYVDWRIRRYVRAKQKLVKLLEEYKQALIYQAVTGKIDVRTGNPYPAYKDYGVEWLGKVPMHWEVLPGRAMFREINDRGHPDEQMLSVTITRGVLCQADLLVDGSRKDSSNEDKSNYKLVQPGDLVYNKMRAWQGAVGVSAYRGIVSPAYIVQRLRSAENLPRYMHFLLRTPLFTAEAERWSYGIASDQWSLRAKEFKCIYFSLPPLHEQTAIVRFLDAQTAKIDAAIAATRSEIELLREYRERLIADVVTGKVDVREVAARLLEEPAEEEAELEDLEETAEGEAADNEAAAETFSEEEDKP